MTPHSPAVAPRVPLCLAARPARDRVPAPLVLLALALAVALPAAPVAAQARFDRVLGALGVQPCAGSGCWSNHLRLVDLDGDGDLDIVFANYPDFFTGNNAPQPLVVYANNGSGVFTDVSASAVGGYVGNLRQVAVGDVTGNGLPDIYAPQGNGGPHVLFINQGGLVFVDQAASRLPTAYPAGGAARMADVDNDGDLDIIAADGYARPGPPFARLYRNDGSGVFTEVVGAFPATIDGIDISDLEVFDADRDFDLDVVVNAHSGGIGALWLNDGSGGFAAGGALAPAPPATANHSVTPCDVDGDGDLDLWFDNLATGLREQLQINDGAGNFSDETAARVTGNPGADDNGVACVDIDDDGDMDAVTISLGTTERLLENDGSGMFVHVPGVFPTPINCSLRGEFGDLNNDGRIDLVTAQGECSSLNEVYFGNSAIPIDTRAPVIVAVEDPGLVSPGATVALRFAVSDRTLDSGGPRLQRAFVAVGDPPAEVDAGAMGGDLYRAVLPAAAAGPVAFQACATDRRGNTGCSGPLGYLVSPLADVVFADGFEPLP
jgi:hypothetical protein